MDGNSFKAGMPGALKPIPEGGHAFVPAPLPPPLDPTEWVNDLAEASAAVGRLNGAALRLVNPRAVIAPLQRREALLSSEMEGTYTTADALALAEADLERVSDPETNEVRNYLRAFNLANELRHEVAISGRLIRACHATLMEGVAPARGARTVPGEYKDQQNFIGGRTRRIEDARFVPPPPSDTAEAMAALERYINDPARSMSPLIDAALFHYQFETIHPFADGNGRLGRLLVPIYLLERGLIEQPIFYLSPVVAGSRDEYVDRLLAVSQTGDWSGWIRYFLGVVTHSARSIVDTIERLERLRADFQERLRGSGSPAHYGTLVDHLFEVPVVTARTAKGIMDTTDPTARNAIGRLQELGILTEVEGSRYPKVYLCWPIVRLSSPDQEE